LRIISAQPLEVKGGGSSSIRPGTMGISFIEDPDGYWVEIVPEKRRSE
jgi:hypothetical protein